MAYSYRTPHDAAAYPRSAAPSPLSSAYRARLLGALFALPALACTVNITDFQATETDSESTGTDSGSELDVDCGQSGAKADVEVTWGIDKVICESEEVCDATRSALCTVEAIEIGETTEVSLACEDPDLGPVSATLAIEVSSPGEIDLAIGAEVTLEDRYVFAFEGLSGWTVRLVDETGGLVISAVQVNRYGGSPDNPWEGEYLSATFAPLTGEAAQGVCGGEPIRGAVKVAQLDAEVWVASGDDDVLVGDRQWSVTVEAATRLLEGIDSGDIDVVVMRTKP